MAYDASRPSDLILEVQQDGTPDERSLVRYIEYLEKESPQLPGFVQFVLTTAAAAIVILIVSAVVALSTFLALWCGSLALGELTK